MSMKLGSIAGLSLVLLAGCGSDLPPLAPLTGTITQDGKPFANGSLMFTPLGGGRPSVAETNAQGEFEAMYNQGVPGAILGKHSVMFEVGGASEPLSEEDAMNLHKKNPRPPKNFRITPTEVEVLEGGTVVEFTLE